MFPPLDEPSFSPDEPEKTGPARFFELLQAECAPLLKLNLLFVLSCVPAVTIPPAIFAMNQVVRNMVAGVPKRLSPGYWTVFRQHWRTAYGAFFLTALPLFLSGGGVLFYLRGMARTPLLLVPFAVCAAILLTVLLASTYLYGLLSQGKPLREAVRPALILGLGRPLRALLAVLCCYGLPLAAILMFPLSGAYLLLIGFSIPCLLGNFYLRTVLPRE